MANKGIKIGFVVWDDVGVAAISISYQTATIF